MADIDEENPPLQRNYLFGLFKNPDPGFPTTVISVIANFILSNMFVFGITGNWRAGFLSGMMTIPISSYLCVKDAEADFERWKEMKALRLRGIPDRFLPKRAKFDWSDYETHMRDTSKS
uniref:MFS domain-containing protein n=1 Tax=Ascaris lumbricoides TaxID=6252 RepID=A0A0M3HXV5_ASCLU